MILFVYDTNRIRVFGIDYWSDNLLRQTNFLTFSDSGPEVNYAQELG